MKVKSPGLSNHPVLPPKVVPWKVTTDTTWEQHNKQLLLNNLPIIENTTKNVAFPTT